LVQEQPQTDALREILRLYGEAILRIGQLEAQVERLTEGRQGPPLPHEQAGLPESSKKLEDLLKQVASSTDVRPFPDRGDDADRDDELDKTRSQISGMAGQLARTNEEEGELGQMRLQVGQPITAAGAVRARSPTLAGTPLSTPWPRRQTKTLVEEGGAEAVTPRLLVSVLSRVARGRTRPAPTTGPFHDCRRAGPESALPRYAKPSW